MNELQIKNLSDDVIEKIENGMIEFQRARQSAGRSETQFIAKHMNIFMLGRTPYWSLRQCLAKIERSKEALKEAEYKHKKKQIALTRLKNKLADLPELAELERQEIQIEIDYIEYGIESSRVYIEGALKNIANYLSIYEQVKKHFNIPDDWDELDYEQAEIEHHIKQAFLQSLRDIIACGSISQGNSEYLENCGIGPIAGLLEIQQFLSVWKKITGDGNPPLMADIDTWLHDMYEKYKDTPNIYLRNHGIQPIDEWYVFKDRNLLEDK